MAYTFTNLSEVTLVESVNEPNLLIEEGGDIKRVSAANVAVPQVKADWNEDDPTSAAYILNKPEISSDASGGAKVVQYTINSGALKNTDGVAVTAQDVIDEWNAGSVLQIINESETGADMGNVVNVYYTLNSGAIDSAAISYYTSTGIQNMSI